MAFAAGLFASTTGAAVEAGDASISLLGCFFASFCLSSLMRSLVCTLFDFALATGAEAVGCFIGAAGGGPEGGIGGGGGDADDESDETGCHGTEATGNVGGVT